MFFLGPVFTFLRTCFWASVFVCLVSRLPAHAREDSHPVMFGDMPVMLHSTRSDTTGNTHLRLAGGVRVGAWLLSFGAWQLGIDGGLALFAPRAKGSPEVFVTPYTTEIVTRGLLGYAVRGSQVAFVPYAFMAISGQFTLVHLRTLVESTFTVDGDIAAEGGVGLAVHIDRWMVRIDAGAGYGLDGLLWRTALALGMQL
ncbi:MAG: hypothetical protein AAF320_04485 [Myxococcota bacterium]